MLLFLLLHQPPPLPFALVKEGGTQLQLGLEEMLWLLALAACSGFAGSLQEKQDLLACPSAVWLGGWCRGKEEVY